MRLLVNRIKSRINCYLKEFEIIPVRQKIYRVICFLAIIYAGIGFINNTFFSNSRELDVIIAVLCIVLSFYLCYIYRYNTGLFIAMVFIAYANYSVCMMYLDSSLRHEILHGQFGAYAYSEALFCVYVFELCLLLFSEKNVADPKMIDSRKEMVIKHETNYIVAFGAMALYLLIFFLTFDFSSDGSRGGGSALAEYRAIVVVIGCYYSAKKISMKILWTVIVGFTSVMVFLGGNRIDAFASLLAVFFFWYSGFLTYKKILLCLPVFIIGMMAIGVVRGGAFNIDVLLSVINNLLNSKLTWDTPMFAYVPSLAIVDMTDMVDLADKAVLLLQNVLYVFVGSSLGNSHDLIIYSLAFFFHYGGCITPVYFYFWIGYCGALLCAGLVLLYKKFYQSTLQSEKLDSLKEKLKYLISVYFVCNVARWYCYGPNGLIRNIFVFIVVYLIVYLFVLCYEKVRKNILLKYEK